MRHASPLTADVLLEHEDEELLVGIELVLGDLQLGEEVREGLVGGGEDARGGVEDGSRETSAAGGGGGDEMS